MTEEDYITMETFAYFGKAIYMAQTIEKGLMSIISFYQLRNNITRTRYDEILFEKSQLTFGQLKREIKELEFFSDEELDKFHSNRDFLAHSYWWERAVEFSQIDKCSGLQNELSNYTLFFEELSNKIEIKQNELTKGLNINFNDIQDDMISKGKTIPLESFEKLSKNARVLDIFGYQVAENSFIPIFEIGENTYFTVCEIGLSQYKSIIVEKNKKRLSNLQGIFPINQFNPRPKNCKLWDYELDLKNKGLKMRISRDTQSGSVIWYIV